MIDSEKTIFPLDCLYILRQARSLAMYFFRRYYLFGLYDKEGMLRVTCTDKEACIAYAQLFDLPSIEFSLMPLLEVNEDESNLIS